MGEGGRRGGERGWEGVGEGVGEGGRGGGGGSGDRTRELIQIRAGKKRYRNAFTGLCS